MAEYHRMENIQPVCTRDYAREYFNNSGLTYRSIAYYDIQMLTVLLNKEYQKSDAACETGVPMTLDKDYTYNPVPEGESMYSCYLTVSAHYFTNRECISFNSDGFIGFAGWADQGNVNPILRAFLKWCDLLKNDYEGIFDERN